MSREKLLRLNHLCIAYGTKQTGFHEVVHDFSAELDEGEILCIAGESGSGKSTVLKAIVGMPSYVTEVMSGEVLFRGKDLVPMGWDERQKLLGTEIGLVQQNPAAAFNPIRTYEKQFQETLLSHGHPYDQTEILETFGKLGLPKDERILKSCPYEMSGGMNQRIAIALITLLKPPLLLCDEVTSALDVTTQDQVADELLKLRDTTGIAILLITHNLGLAAKMADRVAILFGGERKEYGPVEQVLRHPKSSDTKKLLGAIPTFHKELPKRDLSGDVILTIDNAVRNYHVNGNTVHALRGVSLDVHRGEILGIVGESGSGKSTILRHAACLDHLTDGAITLKGRDVTHGTPKKVCADLQMVFQDAYASFDPRKKLRDSLLETLRIANKRAGRKETKEQMEEVMTRHIKAVGLDPELLDRYPSRLSGGQCQRMAIARAVSVHPDLLLCDEATSALDVFAQEEVVKLLSRLREELDITILFISHDLALVHSFCDRVIVLKDGAVVETGKAHDVICSPKEEYTKQLMASVLTLDELDKRSDLHAESSEDGD